MFDLITGKAIHTPHTPVVPILVSTAAHVAVVGLAIVLPWLYITDQLPEAPTMMAFVAAPPPPPPPPPPAPAPAPARQPEPTPAPTSGIVAPVEAPPQIAPETLAVDAGEEGMVGVEGGVPGGIVEGIVGGFEMEIPPPPPPPSRPKGRFVSAANSSSRRSSIGWSRCIPASPFRRGSRGRSSSRRLSIRRDASRA